MGYATDDIPSKRLPPLKEIHNNKNLNQEIEAKIESSLVATLQAKCSELGREIEEDKALKKQTEVENSFLKSQIMNMEQVTFRFIFAQTQMIRKFAKSMLC